MSCGHSYHFRCLTDWFASQVETGVTCSCPSCRHEAKGYEDLPEERTTEDEDDDEENDDEENDDEEDSEENDGEEEEEEEEMEIPLNPAKFKLSVVMDYDEDVDDFVPRVVLAGEAPDPSEEATKIQSLFRGFQDRRLVRRAMNFQELPSIDC